MGAGGTLLESTGSSRLLSGPGAPHGDHTGAGLRGMAALLAGEAWKVAQRCCLLLYFRPCLDQTVHSAQPLRPGLRLAWDQEPEVGGRARPGQARTEA